MTTRKKIKRALSEAGTTAYKIAPKAGISRAHLYYLLAQDGREPSVQTLSKLAKALKVPKTALIGD